MKSVTGHGLGFAIVSVLVLWMDILNRQLALVSVLALTSGISMVFFIGNGHQVYGDEIAFGIIPKLGIGYNWFITDGITLFTETGFYKEFDVIYTRSNMNVNSFGIYLSIGFRIKDI